MKNLDLGKNENSSKGITLVALVISIIVLLILATVSIQVLTGDNGLLTKTETAVQSNKDSQEEEKIKLAVAAAQLAGNGTITTQNLNYELKSIFQDDEEVEEKEDCWYYEKYIIFKDGRIGIKKITLDYNTINIERFNTFKLSIIQSDILNNDIIWSSDDETIATVSDDGIITGIKKGITKITAKSKIDSRIKDTCDVNVTPLYIIKDGRLINNSYIIPIDDEVSSVTQEEEYVEFYAYTPSQYKTGVGWKFDAEKEFESLTMVWTAPERSDSAAWGSSLYIGKEEPIYNKNSERYPDRTYGHKTLFKNNSGVIVDKQETSIDLQPQTDSKQWFVVLRNVL